jgi:hybrid cluster-associated redox disulfide protein
MPEEKDRITPDMTLLEVLYQHRQTEEVFRRYEEEGQGCLLCHALFDTLAEAAAKYGLDLDRLLKDLREAARGE